MEWTILRRFYRLADRNGLMLPDVGRFRKDMNLDLTFNDPRADFNPWPPEEIFEIAGLAQHHGLPTRFLDWTYDPFIACYFASEAKPTDNGFLCIWAISHVPIYFQTIGASASKLRFVVPPYFGNPNLSAQSGLFTIWIEESEPLTTTNAAEFIQKTTDREPLDKKIINALQSDWDNNFDEPMLYKLILPKSESSELRQILIEAGYGGARLFPGYDGVVKELG